MAELKFLCPVCERQLARKYSSSLKTTIWYCEFCANEEPVVSPQIYIAAVNGRKEFRLAYKRELKKNRKYEKVLRYYAQLPDGELAHKILNEEAVPQSKIKRHRRSRAARG